MYPTDEQKRLVNSYHTEKHKLELMLPDLEKAVSHAVNCEGIDAKVNTPDWVIAQTLAPHILQYLLGITGVQLCEQMTKEEHKKFFGPENQGSLENFKG